MLKLSQKAGLTFLALSACLGIGSALSMSSSAQSIGNACSRYIQSGKPLNWVSIQIDSGGYQDGNYGIYIFHQYTNGTFTVDQFNDVANVRLRDLPVSFYRDTFTIINRDYNETWRGKCTPERGIIGTVSIPGNSDFIFAMWPTP